MDSAFDVSSFTTLPRKKRDRLPSVEELQAMSLERRLASLNISRSVVPVPPPRMKRIQKRMSSLPDKLAYTPPTKPELYAEQGHQAHSFDSSVEFREDLHLNGYQVPGYDEYCYSPESSPVKEQYSKYEVMRKDFGSRDTNGYRHKDKPKQPLCDIIESSQQTSASKSQLRRPDILRGSFNADLRSKMLTEDRPISQSGRLIHSKMSSYDKERSTSNHQQRSPTSVSAANNNNSLTENRSRALSDRHQQLINNRHPDLDQRPHKEDKMSNHKHQTHKSTSSSGSNGSNNRFMFYRPKTEKSPKQNLNSNGLGNNSTGIHHDGKGIISSPEGSFVNPAFDIVDLPSHKTPSPPSSPQSYSTPILASTPVKPKPVPLSTRPCYSTMGSSFSMRPCTPSPPSQRFRNHKAPLPDTEPEPKPNASFSKKPLVGPSPIKPMISAKQLESSLKQYSSQNSRLDTSDMCSPQALESMMKYYNMKSEKTDDSLSSSPTPPPSKLSASKKLMSPYSSSSSLNVSGDSIDVVLRRKRKIRIRPPSISSDDESVKRVSLEINLAPVVNTSTDEAANNTKNLSTWKGSTNSLSQSRNSLNQTVETLELDDLTSTETAKLLRKQFAKLKVKANSLKVKDNELKQRFVLLQNQRGRVCGHGGSVTKSKLRASPVML